MEAWEKTKIEFKPSKQESAHISLSEVVAANVLETSLQTCVDQFNGENGRTLTDSLTLRHGTRISISKAQMCSFFDPIVDKTVRHVKDLLNEPCNSANPVKYIYLVGGFAESEILQSRVRGEFEGRYGLHVIVPMRPQLMVVTGAVLFGLQKGSTIQSRVARYTYGFEVLNEYDEKNPEHKQRFQQTSLKNTPNGKIRYIILLIIWFCILGVSSQLSSSREAIFAYLRSIPTRAAPLLTSTTPVSFSNCIHPRPQHRDGWTMRE
jgi:molecular chaperone DnaK (HSP70)